MKIVVMEPLGVKMELINALAAPLQAAGHDFVYYTEKDTDQTKLLARVQQADIIMLANQPLSAEIINACPNLKMLSVAFTGVDHIALAACRERGIAVCNAAGYSTNAVAELTFGLAISVIRNIVPCDARCRQAGTKDGLVGFELFGKTFGVVGTGAIGSRVAKLAAAFGCRVLAYSRTPKAELHFLIIALRFDIFVTPIDRTIVTTAASPSGIAATARLTATIKVSSMPSPLIFG